MPTPAPTITPATIDHGATVAGSGETAAMNCASNIPSPMPIAAPTVLSVAASTRNCDRMSHRLAPSAFRMPISRVRSATATSMMFMITIAPTTSPIAGRMMPAMTSFPLMSFQNSSARLRRLQREVVGLRRAQSATSAHHLAHRLLRFDHVAIAGELDLQRVDDLRRLTTWRSGERYGAIDEAVERQARRRCPASATPTTV